MRTVIQAYTCRNLDSLRDLHLDQAMFLATDAGFGSIWKD
jgi:hypothetical protein